MLLSLREYHRPSADGGIERSLELLARREIHTAVLAGGTVLLAADDDAIEAVVDLQQLGLDGIAVTSDPPTLRVGAMATRAALASWLMDDDHASASEPASFRALLAAGARRWGGSAQRHRATIGGALVVAAPDDPLVAALLACDAEVTLHTPAGALVLPVTDFLARRAALLAAPAIVTEVQLPAPAPGAGHALEIVARTPADAPIVLAAATLGVRDGRCTGARLALGGVAETPLLVAAAEPLLEGQPPSEALFDDAGSRVTEQIAPHGDFRGSAAYRRAMAAVLARRALAEAARLAAREGPT